MDKRYYPQRVQRTAVELLLVESGWISQPGAEPATTNTSIALREYSTGDARIDYALFDNNQIIGIVELAHLGETPSEGLRRASYLASMVVQQPRYQEKYGVPFLYLVDDTSIHFLDVRRQDNRSRQLAAFHTPGAMRELVTRNIDSELATLQTIALSHTSLRHPQVEAIRAIEKAIADGQRRMILSMATGTGKTVTVLNEVYRLMKADIARRVLILQNGTSLVAQVVHLLNSLEVEPGLPLAAFFPVYAPAIAGQLITGIDLLATFEEARFIQVSRISDATELLGGRQKSTAPEDQTIRIRPEIPIHAFDLIVVEDLDLTSPGSYRPSIRRLVDYFDAITIGVSSSIPIPDAADIFDNFIAYRYDLSAAVRDGSLVNSDSVSIRPATYGRRTPADNAYKRHGVFLSYASSDAPDAEAITRALREYDIDVWSADSDVVPGEFLFPHILNEIKSQDVFVPLLSPASISSPWIEDQLSAILERRGVEVIPALLKPCPVPRALADRTIVDLSSGVQGLVDCLEASARINLKALSPQFFEDLTRDLLRRLYFDFDESTRAAGRGRDYGYDFRATFRDPLGFADPTEYLIQVKFHKNERSSVSSLQSFAGVIASDERRAHGLLVTNSQFTSVAAKALIRLNDTGIRLLVIDGLRFKNILLRYPDLVTSYFVTSEGTNGNR